MYRQRKQDYAYNVIRDNIINCRDGFESGSILTEEDLCNKLGVSRTPVREAIHRLVGEGLIDVTPGAGMTVSQVRLEDILELFELREGLECLAIRLFIEKFDPNMVEMLNTYIKAIENAYTAGDNEYFAQNDIDFHRIIALGAKNNRLTQSLCNIYEQIHRMAVPALNNDITLLEMSVREHCSISNAIFALNIDVATNASIEHNRHIKSFYLKHYYNI